MKKLDKPVIDFKEYRISKINYRVVDSSDEFEEYRDKDKIISLNVALNDEKNSARLIVSTAVIDEKYSRVAEVEITGYFNINPEVDESSIEQYLVQNGTAILFPYMRSLVSFITSLDNENAIIIPTINTTGFAEGK